MLPTVKRCTVCMVMKLRTEFGSRPAKRDGLRSECKDCHNKARRTRLQAMSDDDRAALYRDEYSRNRLAKLERAKAYRRDNPERAKESDLRCKRLRWAQALITTSRSRAKAAGMRFELAAEDLEHLFKVQKGLCYWLGIPIAASLEKRDPLRPSIDRLDNALGYTKNNVVLTSQFANMGRSAMTSEQMRSFVQKLRALYAI